MKQADLEKLVTRGILLKKNMDLIAATLKPLEDEFDGIKETLKIEMGEEGIKSLEVDEGKASYIQKRGKISYDIESLKTDFEISEEDMEKYQKTSPDSVYVQFFPKKEGKNQ